MTELPLGLRHALETGECVLFIGAGIGAHLLDSQGSPAPTASILAKELAQHFAIDSGEVDDLAKISAIVELRKGRAELETFLRKRLDNLEPDQTLQWLFSVRWRAIFTTNFDFGIQRAYELIATPPQTPITITATSEIVNFDQRFEVPIYHLHGTLFGSAKPQIIITEDDYAHFRERRRMLFELLKREFITSTVLYIGYSNRDPNWKAVLTEMISEFLPATLPHSYRIAPHTDPLDTEILKAKDIETIDSSLADFVKVASLALSDSKINPDRIQNFRSAVPSELIPAFDKSPAAVARLLSSWVYVNQAPFHEKSNLHEFLRGDRPNWALAGSRQIFERDIEDEIYEDLLDYATATKKKTKVDILLGPAGYGTSTLMMTLAARLVQERAGSVFMLKPGRTLLEGDIEFASSLFPEKNPFFFIDSAADHSSALNSAITRLKDTKKMAMFFLGERLNEWRQGHGRPQGKEFHLEPLSDPEINRLVDYLSEHSVLNALEHLKRDLQFAAIKEKHGKELLVVMRESTEGKSFDAILEDEFRGIANSISRRLYLIVCCFYQHGAYVRDALLAQLIGIPLPKLYETTQGATEGVIIYDCIDESKESYAARARHRVIAAVVWERCGDLAERGTLIQSALSALNLNYKADKDAFEHFIRSDRLVDTISSLEGKIKFFETACQKDPKSPYVRQHYARMLLREGKAELALSQIEEALKMDSSVRVLHHTKGHILSSLALNVESVDLARRRLAQSEASYRQCLSMAPKDEFSYQGLAQLFFGWAKRCANSLDSSSEEADYIAKAEEVISNGLRVVRERDGLWIVSSEIQQLLGNQPTHLEALEKAVQESPGSVIARYLLGRAYRKAGQPQKAIEILEPVIKNHHDEFRAFVEYATALMYLGRPYKEAIAVLKLGNLYGLSDPRFIATLGGMLFMDQDFTEAAKVFEEATKRNFTNIELNRIQFRPLDPNNSQELLRISGKVVVVKKGFALIEAVGYPRFLCHGSKFGEIIMRPGLNVTFEIAFAPRGSLADRPRSDNGMTP